MRRCVKEVVETSRVWLRACCQSSAGSYCFGSTAASASHSMPADPLASLTLLFYPHLQRLRAAGRRVDLVLEPKRLKWAFKQAERCNAGAWVG